LRAGQQIKVVRGPFAARVDLRRNQLALTVDGRYAGKFPVSTASSGAIPPGEWVVAEKPAGTAAATSVYAAAGPNPSQAAGRAIVLRSAAGEPATAGMTVRIASADVSPAAAPAANNLRADAAGASPFVVKVSPRDAEELSDILSIGSRVVIQR
jgi:hypothetical protein